MKSNYKNTVSLSEEDRLKRKRYLTATVITCIGLVMILGIAHVVKLGANRMEDMRRQATYDLQKEDTHIRAAGEDIYIHTKHDTEKVPVEKITQLDVDTILPPQTWKEIETMITIPKGEFTMGTDAKYADLQDKPAHKVNLPAYQMDKYLVTNAQYARFLVATNHRPPLGWKHGVMPAGQALYPVTMVSWYDARSYCGWAGKRLPTEAEWEKAARGTDARRWPWGNTMDNKRINTYYDVGSATSVMTYKKGVSPYGLFDMAGNVSEWINDDFVPYKGSNASVEVFKPKKVVAKTAADRSMKVADLQDMDSKFKVRRGGSWKSDPFSTATYHRNFSLPNFASDFFGFRCAKDLSGGNTK